jgi:hypothetical protein
MKLEGKMPAHLIQKAGTGIAVAAVVLAAGSYMQSNPSFTAQPKRLSHELHLQPTHVETVASDAEIEVPKFASGPKLALQPPLVSPQVALPKATEHQVFQPILTPEAVLEKALAGPSCPASLDLSVAENAMIAVTLVATCHPDERVVLKHAGLVVTAKTTFTGAVFTDLPALTQQAIVEVTFKDGSSLKASLDVPEVARLRRFAVQWSDEDAFQLHGLENGADFDTLGDISGATPNTPPAGAPATAGFLSVLGDSTTAFPLLAEVYTYPANPADQPNIVVESAVTAATCGRELLAETLFSAGGKVVKDDLTAAMPACDAIGDYLVLNNLVPDMKVASSE